MIGVFDSGLGGLVVLKSFLEKLPNYNYLYLADTANLPYGEKRQSEIYSLTQKAVSFLFQQGCQLVILACNTISAEALRKIQQEWLPKHYPTRRVLGVIRPTVEVVGELTNREKLKVGVLATSATVNSRAYVRELKKINPLVKISQQPAPQLVPLIEKYWGKELNFSSKLDYYLKQYLSKFPDDLDFLILGCTHYSLIYPQICQLVSPKTKIITQNKIIAEKLSDYLQRHSEIDSQLEKNGQLSFLATASSEDFRSKVKMILNQSSKLKA